MAPAVALAIALGATLAGPSVSAQRAPDPGRDLDGPAHALRPADAAELAQALGVTAPNARASASRLAAASQRTVAVSPSSGPDFELPFACGSSWTGSTRSSHSPSRYAVDFNAADDFRKPVLAAAAGTVTLVRSLTYSYGKYVVIDHGNGFSTLYAHMDALTAAVGQRVDQGDMIGLLGTTGGSTGPHLHFEERRNGAYFPPYFTRATWSFGATAASGNCGDRPVAGDWDGNRTDDPAVYRPQTSGSIFRTQPTTTAGDIIWGRPGDMPVVGDFDGDGVSQVGTRLVASTTWQLRSRTGTRATVPAVGRAADLPLTGDWDGNGRAELGYYQWSTRTFVLRWPDGSLRTVVWGGAGQTPVVGDWNGDGKTDVGTFEPTTATWRLKIIGSSSRTIVFGTAGDLPVVGDWNGDRVDDLGVWRPSTAGFSMRSSAAGNRVVTKTAGQRRG